MRIEWIEVENFKGFDKRRFEFDEHFTLIVGENGTGKTSALSTAAVILGAWIGAETGEIPIDLKDPIRWAGVVEASGVVFEPLLPLRYKACLTYPTIEAARIRVPVEVTVELVPGPHAAEHELRRQVGSARSQVEQVLKGSLPVCAYYRADRSFQMDTVTDWNRIMTAKSRKHDGYLEWDRSGMVAKQIHEWLGTQEAIHFQEGIEPPAASAVKAAIVKCLPGAVALRFVAKFGEPVVEWEGGGATGYSRLSDGQRLILALAGDIARRCAVLNPHLADSAPFETPGVVLIDEIDLHLHPRWQRRIMEDLRRVFPKIQFIATTHSPIIISAAKDAKVIHLDAVGAREFPQAYGMDLNWIVEVLQGGEARPPEVAALITQAKELIEDGRLDEARGVAAEIRRLQNGPAPDSNRIESSINNLIALAHEKD